MCIRDSYFTAHAGDKLTRALFVFLHEGGVLFGVAGLERRADEPELTQKDADLLETLSPFVVTQSRAQLAFDDLSREASALRALQRSTSTLVVVDRDLERVLWAANRERGIDWNAEIAPHTKAIVFAAEQAMEARTRGEALPTPPALPFGTVSSVAKLEGDPVFGGARCAVLRVESIEKLSLIHISEPTRPY